MGISNLSVLPTTTSNVTAEAHTFAGPPATIQLAHGIVKASAVTVTSSPAGTTYVQGTDYTLDARTGVITRVASGTITPTQTVLVTYSYYSGTAYSATTDYTADLVNGVIATNTGGTIAAGGAGEPAVCYSGPHHGPEFGHVGGGAG